MAIAVQPSEAALRGDGAERAVEARGTTTRLWHAYTLVFAATCVMVGVY